MAKYKQLELGIHYLLERVFDRLPQI